MAKKMLIDATHAEETRVVVVDGNKVEEFDFESENKRQLAGNIYLAKVTRVEPSLQAAFVDYGGNRHGFLAFSEIHPDYYQIPVADREALMEEERAYAEAMKARDEAEETKPKKRRSRSRTKAADVKSDDAVESIEVSNEPTGMETIDLDESEDGADGPDLEGTSPADRVAETPVEEPGDDAGASEADAEGAAEGASSEDDSEAANSSDAPAIEATEAKDEEAADKSDDAVSETGAQDAPEASEDATEENEGKSEEEARPDATAKDDSIESVADEDDSEDIRPVRKPRPRRYKIQEVIKVRQVLLVQVVKEERGNKGAALTTYLSLAGRYCVLMPNTARGGGISRKITNAPDRKKLKEIAAEIDVPTGAGLIIRTAGAKRTKSEIKRDYEYLQRMWEQIRELTLKSIAPAKIYEEGDLIKRSIRDLYNREIDEVLVEGEGGYRIAKDFMKMIMPSHAKNVKRYEDALPLFARYQVESYLAGMFNPTVQLKSGGYIVIGVTEALVAIDVNSGRATKEGSIEETALKTNLEAAEEVARQLRLRDLAGLIVIDFIDMDERKNNLSVEKRMKERLKTDRARIQVGRISGFGLMEMSRQRLRPGMLEATTQPCPACHGTGLIRSDDNMALSILRQIEEEGTRRRSGEVLVRCPVSIANFLMNQKREHIAQIEARYGLSVRVEGDVHLVSPDFSMEKFKTASRIVPEASAPVVSVDASLMDLVDASEDEPVEEDATVQAEEDAKPKRKRRRRRRKKSNGSDETPEVNAEEGDAAASEESDEAKTEAADDAKPEGEASEPAEEEKAAKPKRRRAPRRKKKDAEPVEATEEVAAESVVSKDAQTASPEAPAEETGATDAPVEGPVETAEKAEQAETAAEQPVPEAESVVEEKVEPAEAEQPEPVAEVAAEDPQEPAEIMVEEAPEPVLEVVAEEPEQPAKPKRRGWWSLGQ
ncbi:Rne/Rng family ribonuclease [Ruegeria sp. A3M17]|uniref:Rne/Rng family ribonuclease n=1 Tax=Ruegeria sp. A3M17 TaxID=2267229 RepID=UPI000DEBBE22|nr:Rne/Rng family ribonuclease [Ruegeria sp. A3M17]RBW56108.1 ribonuclease E/G [Ruegeria sp. A3M17]